MKTFQFTCAVRIKDSSSPWDGALITMPGILTPPVESETITAAILKLPKTMTWTANPDAEYVVMEVVR